MKTIKHLFSSVIFVILIVLTMSSVSIQDVVEEERVYANYDFEPPTENVEKAISKTAFILMRPQLAENVKEGDGPGKSFLDNMEADFSEMLIARGFTYKGPIDSYDELVYSDKRDNDLVMEVELYWETKGNYIKYSDITQYGGGIVRYYEAKGECTYQGKLNIYLSEPFTHTKVFAKSVKIPSTSFQVKSQKRYRSLVELEKDVLYNNTFDQNYEKTYKDILNTAWKHLDPREIETKKKEADEIKKQSSFKRD
jgi:hypothetical protein